MLLQEKDAEAFKRWVLPKLAISDADSEVLSDYVIALLTVNESEADVRRNCLEQLGDFLHGYTVPFVNDIFKALKDKSYARTPVKEKGVKSQPVPENKTAPIPSIVGPSNSEYEPNPLQITHVPPAGAPKGPAATRAVNTRNNEPEKTNKSRKRKLVEQEGSQRKPGYDPHYSRVEGSGRPLKQTARRGGGVGRNALFGRPEPQNELPLFIPSPPPNFPLPPPGAPPLGLLAMLAAFNPGLPLPSNIPLPPVQQYQQFPKQPCQDYHTKGFCALGTFCPFDHGDAITVPAKKVPEYDPERSFLAVQPHRDVEVKKNNRTEISRAKKGGRPRAEFFLPGPSSDPSNATLVVEQIPPVHFNEDNIRTFFSQFGAIVEMQMHAQKRLAVIKFEDRESAQQAYNSPQAIFDNRFVKVYWHKSESESGAYPGVIGDVETKVDADEEEDKVDPEEVAKRQAVAQTAFEARRKKMQDVDSRAEEVEKQLKVKDEEIRNVKQQLAVLFADEPNASESLAILQAEAANLFAQHDGPETPGRGHGAVRRGYRGRGYTSFRGGYQGRGAYNTSFSNGRSSVKRLDNRPKRLAISPIEPESSKDEALRQHLINVPDCTDIKRHPEQKNTLILTFKERYQAEIFSDAVSTISELGKVTLSWVPNDAFGGAKSTPSSSPADNSSNTDAGSNSTVGKQNQSTSAADTRAQSTGADADMDVADDVDKWR